LLILGVKNLGLLLNVMNFEGCFKNKFGADFGDFLGANLRLILGVANLEGVLGVLGQIWV
jgi:hypothetical protein